MLGAGSRRQGHDLKPNITTEASIPRGHRGASLSRARVRHSRRHPSAGRADMPGAVYYRRGSWNIDLMRE